MILMELLRKSKGYQHIQSSPKLYVCHLNDLLQLIYPSLNLSLTINLASPCHDQLLILLVTFASNFILLDLIVIYFSTLWLIYSYSSYSSSTCPSPFFGCLHLVTLFLQYQCASTFRFRLLILLITTVLSFSIHPLVIFFSLSIFLVDITLTILFSNFL